MAASARSCGEGQRDGQRRRLWMHAPGAGAARAYQQHGRAGRRAGRCQVAGPGGAGRAGPPGRSSVTLDGVQTAGARRSRGRRSVVAVRGLVRARCGGGRRRPPHPPTPPGVAGNFRARKISGCLPPTYRFALVGPPGFVVVLVLVVPEVGVWVELFALVSAVGGVPGVVEFLGHGAGVGVVCVGAVVGRERAPVADRLSELSNFLGLFCRLASERVRVGGLKL